MALFPKLVFAAAGALALLPGLSLASLTPLAAAAPCFAASRQEPDEESVEVANIAVIVGVGNYLHQKDLWGGPAAAGRLRLAYLNKGYQTVLVRPTGSISQSSTVTKADILGAIRRGRALAGSRPIGQFVFAFSGHGGSRTLAGGKVEGVLLSGAASPKLDSEIITSDELEEALGEVPAIQRTAIIDSCYSGLLVRNFGMGSAPEGVTVQAMGAEADDLEAIRPGAYRFGASTDEAAGFLSRTTVQEQNPEEASVAYITASGPGEVSYAYHVGDLSGAEAIEGIESKTVGRYSLAGTYFLDAVAQTIESLPTPATGSEEELYAMVSGNPFKGWRPFVSLARLLDPVKNLMKKANPSLFASILNPQASGLAGLIEAIFPNAFKIPSRSKHKDILQPLLDEMVKSGKTPTEADLKNLINKLVGQIITRSKEDPEMDRTLERYVRMTLPKGVSDSLVAELKKDLKARILANLPGTAPVATSPPLPVTRAGTSDELRRLLLGLGSAGLENGDVLRLELVGGRSAVALTERHQVRLFVSKPGWVVLVNTDQAGDVNLQHPGRGLLIRKEGGLEPSHQDRLAGLVLSAFSTDSMTPVNGGFQRELRFAKATRTGVESYVAVWFPREGGAPPRLLEIESLAKSATAPAPFAVKQTTEQEEAGTGIQIARLSYQVINP